MKNKKSCTRFFSFHSYMTLHSCAHNHMQQVNKWRITTSEQKSHNVYNVWHHNRFPIHSNISASHFKIVPTLRQLRGLLDCFIQCIANSRKRSVWPKVKNIHSFQPASWESYVFIRWHQSFLVQLSPPPHTWNALSTRIYYDSPVSSTALYPSIRRGVHIFYEHSWNIYF